MDASLSQLRYERKFVASALSLQETLAVVRRHPAVFREVYPDRWVNNIYLDSIDLRDYHDHVNGVSRRSKTRVRWYGPWSGPPRTPVLERKLKQGLVSRKVSHFLPPLATNGHLPTCDLESALDRANLPPFTRASLRHSLPSLLNRYQRHYFQSADGRFRLTVDSNLQSGSARQGSRTSFCPPLPLVVIELKYGLNEADGAPTVVSAFPWRLTRCSKYVLGIQHLGA